jgi:hypothetical protein
MTARTEGRPDATASPRLSPEEERLQWAEQERREALAALKRKRAEDAAREAKQSAAERELEALRARGTAELDAVLAELRQALPQSETWYPRVQAALTRYEEGTEPWLAQAGTARAGRYKLDRLLAAHPLAALLPWLALLAGATTTTSGERSE